MRDNPLLDFSGLPRYSDIRPEHVAPAIARLLEDARTTVRAAEDAEPTWDALVAPLDDANERLARAWGCVAHLHAVADAPALREAYNASLPEVTGYWTALWQNERLYARYRALAASRGFAALSVSRRRVVENALRDFRLAGAALAPEAKRRFAEIQKELASLAAKFSENLLDATNAFALFVEDDARLAGIPADAREAAREAAQKEGRAGWKFTLHMPSYLAVMQHAEDRALRQEMYRASATRASEFGPPELDNTPLLGRILALRREAARLLGYANHAEVSLVPKMARSPQEVIAFLRALARRARPFAEREAQELREFARERLGIAQLEAWDVAFASERLRQARHAFSDEEVKQYFALPKVMEGLFRLAGTVFGIEIVEARAPTWHEEVRFYELRERSGEPVGYLYTDLHARETKRGGAWMDEAIARRRRRDGALQLPVAILACNFARGVGGRPALLSHEDVLTLLHEFGHCLHHLLTRAEELGVSGLAGVEWDAVEFPSQFMENFGWEWEVLRELGAHVESGEPLPRALFERLRAAKNFQAGLAMLRQVEYALYDMRLHAEYDPAADAGGAGVLRLLEEVREEVAVLRPPAWNRFPASFSHIFAGGYAAGYYGYKWAEVLSADAWSVFEERGALDREAGARFRDEILAVGGSRPAAESFRAFRGRDPDPEALLRQSGLVGA
jgi:oligopeptidase A